MTVRARLGWIRDCIIAGSRVHIALSAAAEHNRAKAKIIVHHGEAASAIARVISLGAIDFLLQLEPAFVSVDRGHHHTGSNSSEVCLWFSEQPVVAPRGWHDGPPGVPPRPSGDDSRDRRRGRSPPAGDNTDPWQTPGADPWSPSNAAAASAAASQRSPPRKAPRQRIGSDPLWGNWMPSTVVAASVTPDPPWTRPPRSSAPRLRPTGTPPLVVSDIQEGTFVVTGAIDATTLVASVIASGLSLSSTPARRDWADIDSDDSGIAASVDAYSASIDRLAAATHATPGGGKMECDEQPVCDVRVDSLVEKAQRAEQMCRAYSEEFPDDEFTRCRAAQCARLITRIINGPSAEECQDIDDQLDSILSDG